MRRRLGSGALVAAVALSLAVAGCGVPSDKQYSAIQRNDIPFGIADTTTTSTTTTLPPVTTVPPVTTTTAPTDNVTLYFISNNKLLPVPRPLTKPVGPDQVAVALQKGPDEKDLPAGLRSAVPAGAISAVNVAGGVAKVDLAPLFITPTVGPEQPPITPADQSLAFGQIVLTLTSRPGVGQVLFTVQGQPVLPILGDGSQAASAGPVSADSYAGLRSP
ncbi:MAG TPA: GerMN domain-containing protein [Acidimicrobiales bacterium]